MIMNKTGGGGSGSGGVKYRTVGLSEIVFSSTSDSVLPGYRVVRSSETTYYKKFYFPGKVVKILSFKYRARPATTGTSYGEVNTYTGEWTISGNVATPHLNFNRYSKNTDQFFAIIECTAVIEDEADSGTTTTVTLTADEIKNGKNKLLSKNIISISNLVTSASVPSGKDFKIAWLSEIKISGRFLYVKGDNPGQTFTFTVQLAETDTQGILVYNDEIDGGTSRTGFAIDCGFKPKYVLASIIANPSSSGGGVDGIIGGQWSDSYISDTTYDNGYRSSISSVDSYGYTMGFYCSYNESTGRATVDFGMTYGAYQDYDLNVLAVG